VTELRPAGTADLAALVRIEEACFPEAPWSRDLLSNALRDADTVCLIDTPNRAGAEPRGWGAVLAAQGGGEADILALGVLPGHRGAGRGRALLEALCAAAAARGARRVFLEVRVDNAAARGLYRAAGFEEIGRRPRYYQPGGVDAVVMRRALDAVRRDGGAA
jgi:ribosomal-protein-alanine acetyltransferase